MRWRSGQGNTHRPAGERQVLGRRHLGGIVLLGALLTVVGTHAWRTPAHEPPPRPVATAVPAAVPGPLPSLPAGAGPLYDTGPPAAGAGLPRVSPAASTEAASVRQLRAAPCGLGTRADAAAGAPEADAQHPWGLHELPEPVGREALAQARAQTLDRLALGPANDRVAALLLQEPRADDPVAAARWSESLLREALASQDPAALTWARSACRQAPDDAACRAALARARVAADPGNAVHWLALAEADPAAHDEAWRGLQTATRWAATELSWTRALHASVPAELPAYLRHALLERWAAREDELAPVGEGPLLERCTQVNPPDPACGRLAQLLVQRGDSLQALRLGAQLGRAAGWAAPALQAIEHEAQALGRIESRIHQVSLRERLSCDSVERVSRYRADTRHLGELDALRVRRTASAVTLE